MMIFNDPPSFKLANCWYTLVDCDKSPGFEKRLNASVKKLEQRRCKV